MKITKNVNYHPDHLQETSIVEVKTSKSFILDEDKTNADKSELKPNSEFGCLGKHFIVDFWGAQYLTSIDEIESALTNAAEVSGSTLLHIHLHQFTDGGGITGVALLAESHISVHTWPEYDYAAFDVFMCGDAEPHKAVELLRTVFMPAKVEINEIFRGKLE